MKPMMPIPMNSTVFEYIITVMDNFDNYLKQMYKTSQRKEEKIWYDSRVKFLKRFRENEILPLRRFLQTPLDSEFIAWKNLEELKAFEKMGKEKELMKRLKEE